MTLLIQVFCFCFSGEQNDKTQIPTNPEKVTFSESQKKYPVKVITWSSVIFFQGDQEEDGECLRNQRNWQFLCLCSEHCKLEETEALVVHLKN